MENVLTKLDSIAPVVVVGIVVSFCKVVISLNETYVATFLLLCLAINTRRMRSTGFIRDVQVNKFVSVSVCVIFERSKIESLVINLAKLHTCV